MRDEPIGALTGLRGAAALWVVAFHLGPELSAAVPSLAVLRPWLDAGYLGVDLFFALSGYVLALRYRDEWARGATHVGSYLRRRLARILPLHVAVLGALTLGVGAAQVLGFERFAASPAWRGDAWLPQLLLVHAWGGQVPAWNVPSWSLSCEWLGYLSLPLLLPLVTRLPRRLVPFAVALSVGGGLAVGLARYGHWDLTHEGAVLRFFTTFVAGVGFARVRLPPHRRLVPALVLVLLVATPSGEAALIVPLLVALVVALASDQGAVARLLAHPRAQRLGVMSFALYLVHEPVLLVVGTAAPASLEGTAPLLALQLAAVAAVTRLAHRHVEEPARRLLLGGAPRKVRA